MVYVCGKLALPPLQVPLFHRLLLGTTSTTAPTFNLGAPSTAAPGASTAGTVCLAGDGFVRHAVVPEYPICLMHADHKLHKCGRIRVHRRPFAFKLAFLLLSKKCTTGCGAELQPPRELSGGACCFRSRYGAQCETAHTWL